MVFWYLGSVGPWGTVSDAKDFSVLSQIPMVSMVQALLELLLYSRQLDTLSRVSSRLCLEV